jgi:type I restriction enzyme, S subunit
LFRVKNRIKNTFLVYVLMNEKTISEMVMKSKATAGQFNLTLEICRAIEIPVPSLNEQQKIVRRVEALFAKADRIEAQYKNARQQVDRHASRPPSQNLSR